MALELRIRKGATIVDINNTAGLKVLQYNPLWGAKGNLVTDRVEVVYTAADFASEIGSYFMTASYWAEYYPNDPDYRIYIQMKDSTIHSTWFESRIYDGTISIRDRGSGKHLEFTFDRDPYWQDVDLSEVISEDAIEIIGNFFKISTNSPALGVLSNYARYKNVSGTYPALAEITFSYAGTGGGIDVGGITDIYYGWSSLSYTPANILNLDATDATPSIPNTPIVSTEFNNDDAVEANSFTWSLDGSVKGVFRPFVRANFTVTGTFVFSVKNVGSNDVFTISKEVTATGQQFIEWDDIVLPPSNRIPSPRPNYEIIFKGETTETCQLDFITLIPTERYRKISFDGFNLSFGDVFVDDGIKDVAYVTDSGNKRADITTLGDRIEMLPNKMLPTTDAQLLQMVLITGDPTKFDDVQIVLTVNIKARYNLIPL